MGSYLWLWEAVQELVKLYPIVAASPRGERGWGRGWGVGLVPQAQRRRWHLPTEVCDLGSEATTAAGGCSVATQWGPRSSRAALWFAIFQGRDAVSREK